MSSVSVGGGTILQPPILILWSSFRKYDVLHYSFGRHLLGVNYGPDTVINPRNTEIEKQKGKKEKKQVPDLQELCLLQRWDGIASNRQINKHITHSALQNYSWEEWGRRRGSQENILGPKSTWTVRHCTCRIGQDGKGCAWEGSRGKHSHRTTPHTKPGGSNAPGTFG